MHRKRWRKMSATQRYLDTGNSVIARFEAEQKAYNEYEDALQTAYDELSHDMETLRQAVRHVAECNGVEYDDLIKEVKEFL